MRTARRCALTTLSRAASDGVAVLPARPVFKIEPKPRRQRHDLTMRGNRRVGHVILGLDRLTSHAAQMDREPELKIIRRALELTQEEFAARYHIPLGTLRDWEQGRAEPDQTAQTYLTLIARDPDHVNRTLNRTPN